MSQSLTLLALSLEYRLRDGRIEVRSLAPGSPDWKETTRSALRDEYPADGDLWQWLRSRGITRPSPSGTADARTDEHRAERGYERLSCRPRHGTLARLERLAHRWGTSRTEALERAVKEAM